MATISKKELIDRIVAESGASRAEVRFAVQRFLELVIEELAKGNRLEFRDFGVFETKLRAARQAQNPRTLERVTVPARRSVRFKIGHFMREALDRQMPGRAPEPPANPATPPVGPAPKPRLKSA